DNQDNKEKELTAYVIVDERKMSIKMKELTFDELFCQICTCLEPKYLLKINNEPFKMQLVDMKNNTIESDEDVRKEFKNGDPLFKLLWVPKIEKIGKIKTIKNALVVMIAISEYCDNKMLCNLPNVREKDVKNFREVFKQELNYEFVCNEEFKMNKEDIDEFLENVIVNHKLYKNKRNYDALIITILGHGEGDALVTSDGEHVPVDEIRSLFNCNKMESLKDCPKIFIIDICRTPQVSNFIRTTKQNNMYDKYGFLTILSTTSGYQIAALSLFSEDIKRTIISRYKMDYPLTQILKEIRANTMKKSDGWYCVESQDTTDYDIFGNIQAKLTTSCDSQITPYIAVLYVSNKKFSQKYISEPYQFSF
ncbi:hypothetical protein RFI_34929, partial [Reticulomyxa filosa]